MLRCALPLGPQKKNPSRKEHIGWIRFCLAEAGCHIPFDMRVEVHMLRATACCHSLALQVPRPTTQFRGGWTVISSLDSYARPVFVGGTSTDLWDHLKLVLNTSAS